MKGRVEGVDNGVLRGWAWDPLRPDHHLSVKVVVADRPPVDAIADRSRGDLKRAGIGAGDHSFKLTLPASHLTGEALEARLLAVDQGGVEHELARRVLMFDLPQANYRGHIDKVHAGRCVGWVQNAANTCERVVIEAVLDGQVVATGKADRHRSGLEKAGIGDGRHGFDLPIPASVWETATLNAALTIRTQDGSPLGTAVLPPSDILAAGLKAAKLAEQSKQREVVARHLDRLQRIAPDNVEVLLLLARLSGQAKDFRTARQHARRAHYIAPGNVHTSVAMARLAHDEGRFEEALSLWPRVQPTDSAYVESLIKSAKAAMALSRPAQALTFAKRLHLDHPDHPEAHNALAAAYEALGVEKLAVPHLKIALAAKPADAKLARRLQNAARKTQPAPASVNPLRNSTLADWRHPLQGSAETAVEPAAGVRLGPESPGGTLVYRLVQPQDAVTGQTPCHGLEIQTASAPGVVAFQLDPAVRPLLKFGLRLSLEAVAAGDHDAELQVHFSTEVSGATSASPQLLVVQAGRRRRMWSFDIRLDQAAWNEGDQAWLVVRIAADRSVLLWPPQPQAVLSATPCLPSGLEGLSPQAVDILVGVNGR